MPPRTPQSDELGALAVEDRFVRSLPADADCTNQPRQVRGAAYSWVEPTPVRAPELVAASREVAEDLGLTEAACATPAFAEVFAGNRLLPGMQAHAMCYGGHQFGHWAGQLGDGRAINLGEVRDRAGVLQMLQLKGAGPTPYSRSADGLAVLRSSVREFLCSEAMHHLGVPTTRALSLVLTGEDVLRDMFYDGRPDYEPGAVVCRVAPSFLRFGSYELPAATAQLELLKTLVDYTLREHFTALHPASGAPDRDAHVAWFREVCRRTAALIVHWQRVGFVHGVMNTDNLSILGLTIDYGPYGWLEGYDETWTPNTTDAQHRRYRFGTQGRVAQWNLAQLGSALVPLVGDAAPLQEALDDYGRDYETQWLAMMRRKLGLSRDDGAEDAALIDALRVLLGSVETDMTLWFRRLADVPASFGTGDAAADDRAIAGMADADYAELPAEARAQRVAWLQRYAARVRAEGGEDAARAVRMHAVNPLYVLRNYLAQVAIDRAAGGDFTRVREQLDVLRRPYDEQPGRDEFAEKRPEWARHRPGCSTLSCSS
ncbi:MAG: YdiU family protein [Planctomycetota bacterium]